MTRTAGPTTEILMKRVRQHGGIAVDPSFALRTLSRCQRIVNAGVRRIVTSTTLNTKKNKTIYSYRTDISDAIDILSIKEGTRELQKCNTLDELTAYDIDWFRATGTRFEAWHQYARDYLILYPAKTTASSMTVIYTKLTEALDDFGTDYNTTLELANEDVDLALTLAEAILLIRGKEYDVAQKRIALLGESLAPLVGGTA